MANTRKGKKPFKGNRNNSYRNNTKDEIESKVSREKFNDPDWYFREPQLAKDVASLSFNNALGSPVTFNQELTQIQGTNTSLTTIYPGIGVIYTVPAMGISKDSSSPINIAAKNIYSWVRHQNSGHANYDAPDLMMYLGAMDSVYSAIATLMRVYGTARTFSQVNRYIGDALIRAQGFDPNEVRANLANFRAYINMLITKASAFCTPNVMSLYKRHFWMFSGVYKDEDISKSQMYIYRPIALWKYELIDDLGGLQSYPFLGSMNDTGINTTTWQLNEVYSFCNSMLANLVNSEDINIMSGDILKAYGRENLWTLGLINEDYAVLPVYSEEVLDQIHNTNFAGRAPTRGNNSGSTTDPIITINAFNVTQNADPTQDGRVVFSPQFIKNAQLTYTRMLDLVDDSPTPERVLVATRNMVMGHNFQCGGAQGNNTSVTELDTCGSDIALFMGIYSVSTTAATGVTIQYAFLSDVSSITGNAAFIFKRFPLLYLMTNTTGISALQAITGQIDNYTTVSYDDLKRMHETAILSMLGVPFYGLSSVR